MSRQAQMSPGYKSCPRCAETHSKGEEGDPGSGSSLVSAKNVLKGGCLLVSWALQCRPEEERTLCARPPGLRASWERGEQAEEGCVRGGGLGEGAGRCCNIKPLLAQPGQWGLFGSILSSEAFCPLRYYQGFSDVDLP